MRIHCWRTTYTHDAPSYFPHFFHPRRISTKKIIITCIIAKTDSASSREQKKKANKKCCFPYRREQAPEPIREWVAQKKNRYSLWMACRDTSGLEIYALMPSPTPRRRCWHDDAEAYCKGTIWQSSMRPESQCASSRVKLAWLRLDGAIDDDPGSGCGGKLCDYFTFFLYSYHWNVFFTLAKRLLKTSTRFHCRGCFSVGEWWAFWKTRRKIDNPPFFIVN